MSNTDSIAFTLYLDTWLAENETLSEFSESTIKALYHKWRTQWIPSLKEEHRGDCTNIPLACVRCNTEELFENAAAIDKVIKEYKYEQIKQYREEEIPNRTTSRRYDD